MAGRRASAIQAEKTISDGKFITRALPQIPDEALDGQNMYPPFPPQVSFPFNTSLLEPHNTDAKYDTFFAHSFSVISGMMSDNEKPSHPIVITRSQQLHIYNSVFSARHIRLSEYGSVISVCRAPVSKPPFLSTSIILYAHLIAHDSEKGVFPAQKKPAFGISVI
jgi:hypothetical protein